MDKTMPKNAPEDVKELAREAVEAFYCAGNIVKPEPITAVILADRERRAAEPVAQKERPDFIAGYDAGMKDGRYLSSGNADEILRPLEDVSTSFDGVCDWKEVAKAIDEVRRRLRAAPVPAAGVDMVKVPRADLEFIVEIANRNEASFTGDHLAHMLAASHTDAPQGGREK